MRTTLPHGLFDEQGVLHREAELAALSGYEELSLSSGVATAGEVSALLGACVERVGAIDRFSTDHASLLTRGDRYHLALRLLASARGERLPVVVRCVNPSCAEPADVDIRLDELSPDGEGDVLETIVVETSAGEAELREPIGADDEAIQTIQSHDPEGASALLWSRLVLSFNGAPLTPDEWCALDVDVRRTIALALADATTAPDLDMVGRCPSCAAWMAFAIDPFELLARELARGEERLLAEVHTLAFHYHWSESEVLALPRARRWTYLRLIRRELEGSPLLDVRYP